MGSGRHGERISVGRILLGIGIEGFDFEGDISGLCTRGGPPEHPDVENEILCIGPDVVFVEILPHTDDRLLIVGKARLCRIANTWQTGPLVVVFPVGLGQRPGDGHRLLGTARRSVPVPRGDCLEIVVGPYQQITGIVVVGRIIHRTVVVVSRVVAKITARCGISRTDLSPVDPVVCRVEGTNDSPCLTVFCRDIDIGRHSHGSREDQPAKYAGKARNLHPFIPPFSVVLGSDRFLLL